MGSYTRHSHIHHLWEGWENHESDNHYTPGDLWAPDFLAPFFREWDTAQEIAAAVGDIEISIESGGSGKERKITIPVQQIVQLLLVHQQAERVGYRGDRDNPLVDQILLGKIIPPEFQKEKDRINFYTGSRDYDDEDIHYYEPTEIYEDPFTDIPDFYTFLSLYSIKEEGKLDEYMQKTYGSTSVGKVRFNGDYVNTFVKDGSLFVSHDDINFRVNYQRTSRGLSVSFICDDKDDVVEKVMKWAQSKAQEAEQIMIQDLKWKIIDHQFKEFEISNDKPKEELLLDDESKSRLFQPLKEFWEGKIKKRSIVLAGKPWLWKTLAGIQMLLERPEDVTAIIVKASSIQNSEKINNLFRIARKLRPCMLLIDDAEHLMKMDNNGERTELARAMIDELDSFEDNEGMFLMLTTNYANEIDPALSQRPWRINDFIYFGAPDRNIRKKYIVNWIEENKISNILASRIKKFTTYSKWCSLDIIRGALEEWKTFKQDDKRFYETVDRIGKDYIENNSLLQKLGLLKDKFRGWASKKD